VTYPQVIHTILDSYPQNVDNYLAGVLEKSEKVAIWVITYVSGN
jgi:stage V sporulation protein SpoVS